MRRMNDSPSFATRAEASKFVTNAQKIWVYYMHWLTCCILTSIENGYNSAWNFGAAINMSTTEFVHRINKTAFYGSGQSLRRLMSHVVYSNAMDFLCAHFISKYSRRLLVTEHQGAVHLTMWPIPKETPMDPSQEEPAEQFMRMYLHQNGLTIDDLDNEVMLAEAEDEDTSMYMIKCM
ncbi:hypothetical protein DFH07DRAFT_822955 [Mycena maculata]|uniref:Uncharacterized protein n=1 Tax=Mycena maculata TaxID=230809 RepID=A0AAD7NC84_9AGAR|nr:hypothetical protein DFH07DRAFT_822955 [Mycena maculata]